MVPSSNRYLPETLRFTAEDSGSQQATIVYVAVEGERPILSGGIKLDLDWKPSRGGIYEAQQTKVNCQ
ncbi:MAG: hypothetical protein FJ308_06955 [Planctomycetes bacterium]|nr:hypothetical protein [Planctomycetota bacterium]